MRLLAFLLFAGCVSLACQDVPTPVQINDARAVASPSLEFISEITCGSMFLTTQAQVDAFNCNKVSGFLWLKGFDITNVGGLSELTSVSAWLSIDNTSITDLEGLNALTSAHDVNLNSNPNLTNLRGLDALTTVAGKFEIWGHAALTSVDGLESLTRVGEMLAVTTNPSLRNVDGLTSLSYVGSLLDFHQNDALENVDGLAGLHAVGGDLSMWGNPQLSQCTCGLLGLLTTGGVGGSVHLGGNAKGCDSWAEIVEGAAEYPECGCSSLASEIADLVKDGVLTVGQGVALTRRLAHAMKKADDGQYTVAQNLARSVISHVLSLLAEGTLSPEQASYLVGRITLLINIWSEM